MSRRNRSIRTPLGRVRGLGAARRRHRRFLATAADGDRHDPADRAGDRHRHDDARPQSRGSDANSRLYGLVAIVLILFIIASVWHMKIGMQVVIEDYVHDERLKLISIIGNNFFSVAVALAAIYAILKLSVGV